MHQCLKCGRIITDVAQIQEGCECGSQVFVFIKSESHVKKRETKSTMSLMDFEKGKDESEKGKDGATQAAHAETAHESHAEPRVQSSPQIQSTVPHAESLISSPLAKDDEKKPIRPDSVASSAQGDFEEEKWDEIWLAKGGAISAPDAFDLENIRQVKKGVYEVDVTALAEEDPLVIKDELGVYYVRLPFAEIKYSGAGAKKS